MTSTTNLGYRVFQLGANRWTSVTEATESLVTVLDAPQGERSPRTGRLSRSQERARREAADPGYRRRMEDARRRLAHESYDPEVDTIAKLRLANGMSQQQLAHAMRTSQSHIAKIEAGQVRLYLDTAQRLATVLGVSLDRINALVARPEEVRAQVWVS